MTNQPAPKDYMIELSELQLMLARLLRKDVLQELVSLQEKLNSSFVGKYHTLQETRGEDCVWAAKAKKLFLQLQENDIREKIKHIYKNFIEE